MTTTDTRDHGEDRTMSTTLQEGFDNLYRKARELTIMLGQFSERSLTEKLGTPVTALPLAATVALESKWATEPRLPDETIDGRVHDIAEIVGERARAELRREVIAEFANALSDKLDSMPRRWKVAVTLPEFVTFLSAFTEEWISADHVAEGERRMQATDPRITFTHGSTNVTHTMKRSKP